MKYFIHATATHPAELIEQDVLQLNNPVWAKEVAIFKHININNTPMFAFQKNYFLGGIMATITQQERHKQFWCLNSNQILNEEDNTKCKKEGGYLFTACTYNQIDNKTSRKESNVKSFNGLLYLDIDLKADVENIEKYKTNLESIKEKIIMTSSLNNNILFITKSTSGCGLCVAIRLNGQNKDKEDLKIQAEYVLQVFKNQYDILQIDKVLDSSCKDIFTRTRYFVIDKNIIINDTAEPIFLGSNYTLFKTNYLKEKQAKNIINNISKPTFATKQTQTYYKQDLLKLYLEYPPHTYISGLYNKLFTFSIKYLGKGIDYNQLNNDLSVYYRNYLNTTQTKEKLSHQIVLAHEYINSK